MNVCFFAGTAGAAHVLQGRTSERSGGSEVQLARLMRHTASAGHAVTFLHGGTSTATFTVDGVDCVGLDLVVRKPRSASRLWRALRGAAPDAVYARLPDDFLPVIGAFARLPRRCRFVYALSSDAACNPWRMSSHRGWFHNPLYALTLRLVDQVVVQHDGQRELLPERVRRRTTRIPSMIEPHPTGMRDLLATRYDGVWISHLRPVKQIEKFLDLAAALPDLRFAVAGAENGDVPEAQRRAVARRMAALPNLDYHGILAREQVAELLAGSRVLVNTSAHEGYPNTMLEAWAQGVPVVSLGVDPHGVITSESLGLVSGGSAACLTEQVLRLSRCEELNRRLGGNGFDYVRRTHAPEQVLPALLSGLSGTGSRWC